MTSDSRAAVPQAVYDALQASGFPFQTAVESLVRKLPDWSVTAVEFPWHDPASGAQFLDLVAAHDTLTVTVECKKTRKETLTFLLPEERARSETDAARLLYAEQIQDMTRRFELFCSWWGVGPASLESAFCVVSTSSAGKDQRMLERDAQRVVRATDAYAQSVAKRRPTGLSEPRRPFMPTIVTNTPLYVARYEPSDVSLGTGEFKERPKAIEAVPWLRFRKSFTSAGGIDLGERTVFVVNAQSLADFLVAAEAIPRQPTDGARGHLPKPDR